MSLQFSSQRDVIGTGVLFLRFLPHLYSGGNSDSFPSLSVSVTIVTRTGRGVNLPSRELIEALTLPLLYSKVKETSFKYNFCLVSSNYLSE